MASYNIDFSQCIIAEIHTRAFWKVTTLPFPCLIYMLCRNFSAPIISGADRLVEVTRIQDAGLIKDDTNPITQQRSSQPEVVLPKLFDGQAVAQDKNVAVPDSSTPAMESSKAVATSPHLFLLEYHVHNRWALSPFQLRCCKTWCRDRLRLTLS